MTKLQNELVSAKRKLIVNDKVTKRTSECKEKTNSE